MNIADPKVYENSNKTDADSEATNKSRVRWLVFLQILAVIGFLGFFYQQLTTNPTFFTPGTTSCAWDSALNFPRWMYFAVAIALCIDLRASITSGDKYKGGWALITNLLTIAIIFFAVVIPYIVYVGIQSPNADGNINGNIATNPRACGDATIYGNEANGCIGINPESVPLNPPVTAATLPWGPDYLIWSCWLLGYLFILHLPKTFFNATLKHAYSKLNYLLSLGNAVTSTKALSGEDNSRGFYAFSRAWQVEWYPKIELTEFIIVGFFTVGWFAWFQQEMKTLVYKYIYVAASPPYNTLDHTPSSMLNYLFLAFLSVNLIAFWLNGFLMEREYNTWAIVGSAIAIAVNIVLLIIVVSYYIPTHNQDGYGTNFFNDPTLCKSYKTTPTYFQFYTNPANRCPNTYTCADQVDWITLTMSPAGIFVTIMLSVNTIIFFVIVVFGLSVRRRILHFELNGEEYVKREEENIARDIWDGVLGKKVEVIENTQPEPQQNYPTNAPSFQLKQIATKNIPMQPVPLASSTPNK